ncbi:MAG: asparagine synthase (glutamine-hydrolyzing) [Woeseiaceae bacterium]
MCGIAGFTPNNPAQDSRAIASNMLAVMAHRGPDEEDIVIRDEFTFVHNRLTIMEPDGGQQPRVNTANGNALIYNGEIYNHRAFDKELLAAGCELRDHCDTETLFWLLELHGVEKTLSMIDGMFAFAWYQASDDTLYLARDRFGQKPLFYANSRGDFVFASEIKALRCHPSLARVTPDIEALRLYLMMEYVPSPATGFNEIDELPAGHMLTYRAGELEVSAWWQAGSVSRDSSIDYGAAVETLDGLLNTAVQQHLVADVPLGVFLSGGIDSSVIAAIAKKHSDDIATFTVKFPYASFDESGYAEEVAQSIGTRHTTIELDRKNCIEGLEDLLTKVDQPFCDSSQLPSYLLCRATREHVTVAVGGDGADELFFGYPNFQLLKFARLMAAMPQAAGGLLRAFAKLFPDSTDYMNRSFLLRQLSYGIGRSAEQQSTYWMSAVAPALQQSVWRDGREAQLQTVAAESSLLASCQRQFIENYLASDILQKMDRASMYASLEVRSPFLAAAVSDYALSLPIEHSFKGTTGKRVLRDVARRYLSEETITRKKHGFAMPVAELLRGDLRGLAKSTLLDAGNGMYQHIDFRTVDRLWSEHANKHRNHGKSLWALLMMAAFFRRQF